MPVTAGMIPGFRTVAAPPTIAAMRYAAFVLGGSRP